ncbi:MAG TPA: glycosyltransferase [bacterium]|nr:glycosyltransferase [bacterium]HOL95344.1 glycosyltransferase [bacterium]HPP02938.1 glycosyltransferase [bacterium]HXK92139.1 glycosyltransferase [bacterium]
MTIRVLLLTTDSKICGTERMILSLLRRLDRGRYTPCLVTLKGPGELVEEATRLGVDAVNLKMDEGLRRGWPRWRKTLYEFQPQVMHAFLHHANLLARFTRLLCRDVRVIAGLRTVYTAAGYGRLYGWLERLTHPLDTFFVVNSEAGWRSLTENMGLPDRKLVLIHNGLELFDEEPDPAQVRHAVRSEFGFFDRHLVVGIVAQLRPPKRHDLLLQAAMDLKERFPNLRLLVIGEGEMEAALKDQAKRGGLEDEVIFTGYRGDARRLLRGMDLFALPSEVEGEPVSILEAMAAGLPVVAARAGGIPELVTHGGTGLLHEPGSREGLRNALTELLASPEKRHEMGAAGRKRIELYFTADIMARRFQELYEKCVMPE